MPQFRFPAENTLQAFEYALAQGCDGFEFDVRFTRDRRNVLCHDAEHRRKKIALTDYPGLDRRRGFERRRAPMACLEDVLAGFGQRAFLDIELKAQGNEEEVVAQVHAHSLTRGFLISSFLPDVLLRLHELDASLPLGYVCKRPEHRVFWKQLPVQVFLPHFSLITQGLVEQVHERKMQLFAWTVNRESDLLLLGRWGVDGLISDDPKLLRRLFPQPTEFQS